MEFSTESIGLPIVDFGPFLQGDHGEKVNIGKELVSALKHVGFVYINNHGVSEEQVEQLFNWSASFFNLKSTEKEKCSQPPGCTYNRGWSSVGREKVVQMVFDKSELENIRKIPDVKESFDYGNETGIYENLWPEESSLPGFRDFCVNHFDICNGVSKQLMRAIALGLELEEEYFISYHSDSDNQSRLLHYPPVAASDIESGKTEGIAAHTDFGTFTMLFQDHAGGLEVMNSQGVYVPAPTIPGSIIVNTGDFLMRWSNDLLKSTMHRVRAPPIDSKTKASKVRYSSPFFVTANKSAIIECLPGTFSSDRPRKYEPITSLEYTTMRFKATY